MLKVNNKNTRKTSFMSFCGICVSGGRGRFGQNGRKLHENYKINIFEKNEIITFQKNEIITLHRQHKLKVLKMFI